MKTLPDKPSESIRLALTDLRACEADPLYNVGMGDWHRPCDGVCHVCLAGAVMAKSLECPREKSFVPSMIKSAYMERAAGVSAEQFQVLTNKLTAIDRFRSGYIGPAFSALNIPKPDAIPDSMFIHAYNISRDEFYNDMEGLATLLEQHGC